MNKEKPTVGQVLYSLNVGNASRGREQVLTEVVVKKVGNKYFSTVRVDWPSGCETQYRIDNWSENTGYCSDSRLYLSPEEWENEKEHEQICEFLCEQFKRGGRPKLSLDTLRKIKELIG